VQLITVSLAMRRPGNIHERIAIYQAIMKHLSHIRELNIHVPDLYILGFYRFNSLSFPLSQINILHSLDFRQPRNRTMFPSLVYLGLLGFLLDFGPCRLPESLTSLRLWGSHSGSDTGIDLFSDVLRGLPFLPNYESVEASSKKLAALHLFPRLQYHYGTFATYASRRTSYHVCTFSRTCPYPINSITTSRCS
jgi:hypothetical protein